MFNRAMGQYTMNQNKQRYTCVSKPGEYELIGTSSGAGTMKGVPVMVYRDLANNRLFHREPENFMARMKKIPAEQSDINAELLAALEVAISALDGAKGNINPERGFVDEVEDEISSALTACDAVIAKAKGGAA